MPSLYLIALLVLLSGSPALLAQPSAPDQPDLFDLDLRELLKLRFTVTSQKRSESLQAVPGAVSLLSGAQLRNSQTHSIEQLSLLLPSLSFRKSTVPLNSALFVRGIGTINFSIATEPSVALVQDGVVMSRSGETFEDLFDVERVEVLSGPQGTLFGKNASAGVVNVISRMPGEQSRSEFDGLYGEDGLYRVNAAVDTPLTPALQTRLALYSSEYDGALHNLANGDDINGYRHYGFRAIARWDASDTLRLTAIADRRRADDDCCVPVLGTPPPPGTNQAAFRELLRGIEFDGDATREARNNLVSKNRDDSWGLSLQIDWQLDELTLTSITARRSWYNREIRERDLLDVTAPYVGAAFAQIHEDGAQQTDTDSQELRLTSPSGQRWEYVVGLFWLDSSPGRRFTRSDVVCDSTPLAADATGLAPCQPASASYSYPEATAHFSSESSNYALFNQNSFELVEGWDLIAGLRYTYDRLAYQHRRIGSPVAGPGVLTSDSDYRDRNDNEDLSGKLGLQWQINSELMTYLSYSQGYKSPAFNVFYNMTDESRNLIDAETADAWELGLKSTLWDGRALFNIAVFDVQYDNFQANNPELVDGILVSRLTNAGAVSTRGAELSLFLQPLEQLGIQAGVNYTDAQIDSFNTPPAQLSGNDRSGERLPYAPEWKASLLADYRWPLGKRPLQGYSSVTASYSDEQKSALGTDPGLVMDAHYRIDWSLGVADRDDRYRVGIFVRNLTDQSYSQLIEPDGPGPGYVYYVPVDAGRLIGVEFSLRFGGD